MEISFLDYLLNESNNSTVKIQGLEDYDLEDLIDIIKEQLQGKLIDAGIEDLKIIDLAIIGSRNRHTAKIDSDLDVVFEYDYDMKEDAVFNIVNEAPKCEIDGIEIDFNPIRKEESGAIKEYLKKSKKYDQEILAKIKK